MTAPSVGSMKRIEAGSHPQSKASARGFQSAIHSVQTRLRSPPPQNPHAADALERRDMSTTKGKNVASTVPGMIKGFGLRQKAPNTGNTALGKGFDLMEDDVGSRQKILIAG